MRSSTRSILSLLRILALVAGLVLLAPINPGRATDGRDFAAFYKVTNPTDLGTDYRVTLTILVFNYSEADVYGASITLQEALPTGADYGAYPDTVAIPDRESVQLSSEFAISRGEYDRWQNGGTPSLRIDYLDSAGNSIRRSIEMTPSVAEVQ